MKQCPALGQNSGLLNPSLLRARADWFAVGGSSVGLSEKISGLKFGYAVLKKQKCVSGRGAYFAAVLHSEVKWHFFVEKEYRRVEI